MNGNDFPIPDEEPLPESECTACGRATTFSAHHCADCWQALYDCPEPDEYSCPFCGRTVPLSDECDCNAPDDDTDIDLYDLLQGGV